jgi:hypothetical protein
MQKYIDYVKNDWAYCNNCGCFMPQRRLASDGICLDVAWCLKAKVRRLEVENEFNQHQEPQLEKVARATEKMARKKLRHVEQKRKASGFVCRDAVEKCVQCGEELEVINSCKGRKTLYCGATCKQKAYRSRRVKR